MSRGSKEEIFGERIFRGVSTFFGDVVFKKRMTLYAPNPTEPSLGTPHPTSDANRTATLVVDTSTNTAGVWSAAVTMTGMPVGTKAAWCYFFLNPAGGAWCRLKAEAATGYTLSDITAGNNVFKYRGIVAYTNTIGEGMCRIPLDANGQFKWCTSVTNSQVKIGSTIDYEE